MKKGFTLVELIVSFALITVISVSLFRTVLSVQQRQSQNIAINKFKAFQLLLNNEIESDFLKKEIESVNSCGTNCFDIEFKEYGTKRLSIDTTNNVISYGSFKEYLPDNYKLIDNMTVKKYESSTAGVNSYIFLNIPIKSSLEPSLDSLKYMYTYDSNEVEIEGDGGTILITEYADLELALLSRIYPVGSIYTSTSNINPGTIFGGTWIEYGTGRTLVGVDTTDNDFNYVGSTRGSKKHQHKYGLIYGGYYISTIFEENPNAGLLDYYDDTNYTLTRGESQGSFTADVNDAVATTYKSVSFNHYLATANTSATKEYQPYITVYRWKRTN